MRKRLLRWVTGCLVSLGLVQALPLHAQEVITEVKDPRYGVAIYRFYQGDFFAALTELAIAEERQDIVHHRDYARLLEGGIELSYGMDKQAEEIFNQVLETTAKPPVQDQAWFYVGKMYYQRGAKQQAAYALLKIKEALVEELRPEFHYLSLLLPNNWNDYAMQTHLHGLEGTGLWHAYGLYNAAMAFYQQRKLDFASDRLQQALLVLDNSDEAALLRDRIYVALAYIRLDEGKIDEAIHTYQNVSLFTPWTQYALLGLGWAALKADMPELALAAWQRLSEQPVAGAAVQEAVLGVPYVFDKLGASKKAYDGFVASEKRFQQELDKLKLIREQLTPKVLYQELVKDHQGPENNWFYRNAGLYLNPISPYISNLVAQPQVQSLLKDLRDMTALNASLRDMQQRLAQLEAVVATREQAQQQVVANAAAMGWQQQLAQLMAQHHALSDGISEQLEQADVLAVLEGDERDLYQRLQRAEQVLAANPQLPDRQQLQEKLTRLRGVLYWQASRDYPDRRWQLEKQQKQLTVLREELKARQQRLQDLLKTQQQPHRFNQRIAELVQRTQEVTQTAQALHYAVAKQLQQTVYAELDKQQARLTYYLTQARMNSARILDDAYREQGVVE